MTRSFWAWARVLGGAGIIAVLVWRLGTGAFLDGVRVIDGGTLLTAFAIGIATTVLSAWRWCLVARGVGLRLSLRSAVAEQYVLLRGLIMHCLRHAWIYVLLFDAPPCVGGIVRVAPATSWNDASTCNSGSIVHTNCITCDRTTYYYRCHERASVRLELAACLSAILTARCEPTVSASFEGSSIWVTAETTSGEIFLLSFT